jgi:hypothetical protein
MPMDDRVISRPHVISARFRAAGVAIPIAVSRRSCHVDETASLLMAAVFDAPGDFDPCDPMRTPPAEGVPCTRAAAAAVTLTRAQMHPIFRQRADPTRVDP